jgi:hypothetical protein
LVEEQVDIVNNENTQDNAVQIKETESVDARQQAAIGEGVGTGVPTAETTELETTETQTDTEQVIETKKFRDDQVVLKEETFTVTDEDGSRQEVTVRTYLDGSLGTGAKVKRFDSNGELIEDSGSFRVKLGDKDIIVRDGKTAEQQVEFIFAPGEEVIEKTSERSGNEINNPKKTAQLTTEQKQKLDTTSDTTTQEIINTKTNEETNTEIAAGNRLFNEPLQAATEIETRVKERTGIDTPKGKRITKLDEERSKRIADAYEKQQSNPNDPEVQESYQALVDETIGQYEDILADGYVIELSDTEYKSSSDMISDLRDNKNMRVFSTEEGFGTDGITDADRAANPMLAPTQFKDKNGKPLLVNDVFRFVHDFFGHSKEGNGFGPVGEENAWDVHSRMYSPLARRAMTTETRGQNSWVNFSGVNEKAFKLRDEARALRKQGKFDEAEAKVKEAYATMNFAEQKVMLLPEEFSLLPEETPEGIALTEEVADLETTLGEDSKVDFRKKEGSSFTPIKGEVDAVTKAINDSDSANVSTNLVVTPEGTIDVSELSNRTDRPLKGISNLSVINGIPVVFNISDQLTTGNVVNPLTGTTIDELKGGLGFTGTIGNENAAWASTTKEEAGVLLERAKSIYNNNVELFKKFWKDNPEFDGHVPMPIVKMGEGSLSSNEAVFRVLRYHQKIK